MDSILIHTMGAVDFDYYNTLGIEENVKENVSASISVLHLTYV